MSALVSNRVAALLAGGFDLTPLLSLTKPLRCFWYNPATPAVLDPDCLPLLPLPAYHALLCLSASPPVDIERRAGYVYIQGAADDEETWAQGLTPASLWSRLDEFQSACAQGDAAVTEHVGAVVGQVLPGGNGADTRGQPVEVVPEQLWLGQPLKRQPQGQLVLSCVDEESFIELGATVLRFDFTTAAYCPLLSASQSPQSPRSASPASTTDHLTSTVLLHAIPAGKRHRHELETCLTPLLLRVRQALAQGQPVCCVGERMDQLDRSVLRVWWWLVRLSKQMCAEQLLLRWPC